MSDVTPKIITDTDESSLGRGLEMLSQIGATITSGCDTEDKMIAAGPNVDAMILFLARTLVTRRVVEALPSCRIIARAGIGVDAIALDAATEKGILVTNVPDYCVDEVSLQAVALLLACARKIPYLDRRVRGGSYDGLEAYPLYRLAGSTVGIVGFGRIGRSVAHKLQGFDLRLLVSDPFVPEEAIREHSAEPTDLEMLLRSSDYVCLLLPVTPSTYHLIGEEQLAMMKPTAYLINTSRGKLIDQPALTQALRNGTIAGAGLDVLEEEPPDQSDPLLQLDNVMLTPHAAWYSEEAMQDSQRKVAEEVVRTLVGQRPRNLVNQEAWDRRR